MLPDTLNPAEFAYLQHLENEEKELQTRIQKARVLDEGYFDTNLAAQTQKKLLGGSQKDIEGINLSAVTRRLLLPRLRIQTVRTAGEDKAQSKWLQQLAKANGLKRAERALNHAAWRDGEAFIILNYEPEAERPWEPHEQGLPRFYVHERYVAADVAWGGENGRGEGCKAHYLNDDPNQQLIMISHRWRETIYQGFSGTPKTRQRMTLYIAAMDGQPPRVERYVIDDNGVPIPYSGDGVEAVTNWVDGSGQPLPLPAVHFRGEQLRPGSKDIWGIQNTLDHFVAGLMGAGTLTAFRLLVALGWYPTIDGQSPEKDGSNLLEFSPGMIIGTEKQGASLSDIPPADLSPLLEAIDRMGTYAAIVQALPVQNFNASRQVASGEAMRAGEAGLVQTAKTYTELFAESWEETFTAARRLDNLLGDGRWNEETAVQVQYESVATRAQDLLLEEVNAKLTAGVTPEQVQSDTLGYDDETIEAMSGGGDAADEEE